MKKMIFLSFMLFSALAFGDHQPGHDTHHGHDDHHNHEDMTPGKPVSGSSIYQLDGQWLNQDGKSISLSSLVGQPRIIAMLYTRCTTACPILVDDILNVLKKLPEKQRQLSVVLFSFDSKNESAATMKEFLKKRKLGANWSVYKSDSSNVAELAAVLGVRYKELKTGEFIHSNSLFFVNEKGEVVASREGLNTANDEFIKAIKAHTK